MYVRPYAGPGPSRMVSTPTPSVRSDPPRKLFDLPEEISPGPLDTTPDGQRFLMIERDPFEPRPLGLVIVPSWTTELKARLAASGPR